MGKRLAVFGVSAALAIGGAGCGEQHASSPDRPAGKPDPQGLVYGPPAPDFKNVKPGQLVKRPAVVRRLLAGPVAHLGSEIKDSPSSRDEKDMAKVYIRTGVCAVIGFRQGGRTIAQYIRQPAVVYRDGPRHGIGETELAGVDPGTGKLVTGQPRILDKQTGEIREVDSHVHEIDIYRQGQSPNLELQPVGLSTDGRAGTTVHNSRGEEVMTVTGAAFTHDTLSQVANDPLTNYACFAGYAGPPPPPGPQP